MLNKLGVCKILCAISLGTASLKVSEMPLLLRTNRRSGYIDSAVYANINRSKLSSYEIHLECNILECFKYYKLNALISFLRKC